MVRPRTAARIARTRQGNCRKASSGAWFQMNAVTGVRRRVMAMVIVARGRRRLGEICTSHPGDAGRDKGSSGEGDENDRYERGCVEDLVVENVDGVVKEKVVLDAHVGDDGHGDLDVAAFVGGREDVEGCET
jgi:hypothetical protein